ncbi:hypothetical protein [Ramlibacter rhizophilus]|uniref:Extradiol ring-cleavage dioxygenase LigAB LigA subunit domain-containing protein n=1 Tax=Ramlibacter rhizophilus TaxID=1781167 RepID=A0A4Z0BF53_9BURK|nr:hypothetical protein [Ramlibacter rhizophilus]TFY97450.1 hypothetical protein EZ242_18175 [Ramlibacter rhizophilus]
MSAGALTQFLVDITRGHRRADFAADAEAVLADAPLSAALREAVRRQDMAALWQAGAHPMALLYFARASGWDNERYYACLAQAQLTPGAGGAPAGATGHAPPRTHPPSAPHAR